MAVGVPAVKTEIAWTAGTWTDVTSFVSAEQTTTGTFGRPTEFDDVAAGTWSVTLRNDDGRFTPDNPLSPYYPNVTENSQMRITVTPPGGSSYIRFLGYITSLQPSFPNADGFTGIVQVDAADLLAVMNRRQLQSGWIEEGNYIAKLYNGWNDTWSFGAIDASSKTTTVFENIGTVGSRTTTGTASIVAANSGAGSNSTGTDDALTEPSLTLSPAGIVGPVLKVVPGGTFQQIEFFVKIPTTGLAVGTTGLCIADFYGGVTGTTEQFSLRAMAVNHGAATTVDLVMYDGTGTLENTIGTAFTAAIDTDTWLKITAYANAGGMIVGVNDSNTGAFFGNHDITQVNRIYFGGWMGATAKDGKQTYCPTMSVAGIDIQGSGHGVFYYYGFGTPPPCTSLQRYTELAGYGSQILPWRSVTDLFGTAGSPVVTSATANFTQADVGKGFTMTGGAYSIGSFLRPSLVGGGTTIVSVQSATQATLSNNVQTTVSAPGVLGIIGPAILGSDDRTVVRYNTSGQTLAEAMQLHARTIGGVMWVNNIGVPTLIGADQVRSSTPIATVDMEADANGDDLELRRSIDQAPTRVTVSSPVVDQAVIIDTVAEAAGYRRETTVDSAAPTYAVAASIGNYYLNASKKLRISKLTVDLAQSQNNLYAAFLGNLRPGARVRITGLPATTFGYTQTDVYVQGWTETYAHDTATITMDCSPADAPVEAIVGDAEYGRVAANTLTLSGAVTSAATTVVIAKPSSTSTGMTATAGDYPLDIDLNGERVTLPAPPSSSTSTTQTYTSVIRGVAPSVARAHSSGEPVDAWHAAAAAF